MRPGGDLGSAGRRGGQIFLFWGSFFACSWNFLLTVELFPYSLFRCLLHALTHCK